MREKLIELLFVGQVLADAECDKQAECNKCQYNAPNACRAGFIADHLIANGVTVQEWISVKDRLPDSGKYVLLYCSDGLYGEGHYRAYENKWYLSKITYKSIPDVTHWAYLPEPPKGE